MSKEENGMPCCLCVVGGLVAFKLLLIRALIEVSMLTVSDDAESSLHPTFQEAV